MELIFYSAASEKTSDMNNHNVRSQVSGWCWSLLCNDLLPGCQTSDSASSSKFHHLALLVVLVSHSSNFHHWPLLALLVALVLNYGDSADLNFAILYMIIVDKR